MAYTVDFADQYVYVDGVEDITYTADAGSPVTEVKVRRGDLGFAQLAGIADFGVQPGDIPMVVWATTLTGVQPAEGDTWTDANGVTYYVVAAQTTPDGSQHVVTSRRAARD